MAGVPVRIAGCFPQHREIRGGTRRAIALRDSQVKPAIPLDLAEGQVLRVLQQAELLRLLNLDGARLAAWRGGCQTKVRVVPYDVGFTRPARDYQAPLTACLLPTNVRWRASFSRHRQPVVRRQCQNLKAEIRLPRATVPGQRLVLADQQGNKLDEALRPAGSNGSWAHGFWVTGGGRVTIELLDIAKYFAWRSIYFDAGTDHELPSSANARDHLWDERLTM